MRYRQKHVLSLLLFFINIYIFIYLYIYIFIYLYIYIFIYLYIYIFIYLYIYIFIYLYIYIFIYLYIYIFIYLYIYIFIYLYIYIFIYIYIENTYLSPILLIAQIKEFLLKGLKSEVSTETCFIICQIWKRISIMALKTMGCS